MSANPHTGISIIPIISGLFIFLALADIIPTWLDWMEYTDKSHSKALLPPQAITALSLAISMVFAALCALLLEVFIKKLR